MLWDKLITVLPLAQIDPDPATLTDRIAAATLGSFQALWDPRLLARSAALPVWALPSNPPLGAAGQLILVPAPTRRFLATAWEEQARAAGAYVIIGEETRPRFLARLQDELPGLSGQMTSEITHDFFALGLARLWLEMLTAYMKHVGTLDETRFEKEVLAAAAATVVADQPTCDNHLRAAFQLLREARDQLYPVDVHLLDLCLVDPRAGVDRLRAQLECGQPVNVFLSGRTAEEVKRRDPAAAELLKRILEEARADIVGGEYDEVASTLLPLESHLWQFSRGGRSYQEAFGRVPHIFGRRRFGFARHVLQLLNRFECQYMTHFSFDDGVVPARSDATVRWEAPDSTTIESLTRIPFAADSPAEYLRLPSRLARSMSGDFVATLVMVHWPMPELPWYGELFRIARYSDVFARFSTLSNYFQTTDPPSFSSSLSSDDYVSPYLANAHRRGDRRPISSVAEQHRRRARFDAIRWLRAVDLAVRRRATEVAAEFDSLETDVETGSATLNERLDESLTSAARPLAELICPPRADGYAGWLIFNPLSFDRQVIVPTDVHTVDAGTPPADATESASPDAASDAPVSAALPAMGFVWLPRGVTSTGTASQAAAVVVEGSMIRNEFLELELDDVTGGIRSLRSPGGRIPLVGQQLVLCGVRSASDSQTESGRTPDGEPAVAEPEPIKSEMRATATSVRLVGPDVAEVVVDGDLRAVPCPAWSDGPRLARFRQTYRLGRGQPVVRVAVEIFDLSKGVFDERADPWQAYLASRFAWLDPRSLMLRGIGTLADLTNARRPESPYFIELHGSRHRTTIVTGGLAFHQRHGDRMLDTLLVTATEECRRFEFGLGVDLPNSFQAALDLIAPPVMIATDAASRGEPEPGVRSGWFFHVDARNVVVTSVTPLGAERPGVRLRAFETAGRYTRAKLRCVHNVTEARMTNFRGQRLATLDHTGDTVPLDLAPHEITQIELEF